MKVTRTIDSPIGPLTLAGSDGRLSNLMMEGQEGDTRGWTSDPTAFGAVVGQLESYFDGELTKFDVELDLVGTEFQLSVWNALLKIPYGRTASYG